MYTTLRAVRPVDDPRPGDGPYGTRGWKHPEVPAGFTFRALEAVNTKDGRCWVRSDEKGTTDPDGIYRAEKWYMLRVGMYQNFEGVWVGGTSAGWLFIYTPPPPEPEPALPWLVRLIVQILEALLRLLGK